MVLVTGSFWSSPGRSVILVVHLTAPAVNGWASWPAAGRGPGHRHDDRAESGLRARHRATPGSGHGSGILSTAQRVGTALGIAIIGTVLFGSLTFVPARTR